MLVRDILPPEKVRKIAREEILGFKSYKNKKTKILNLSLRACIFLCAIVFILSRLSPLEALGENDIWQMAKEVAEIVNIDIGGNQSEENFGDLTLENNQNLFSLEEKLKFKKVEEQDGHEKFVMESLQGDEIKVSDTDETSASPYIDIKKWGGDAALRVKIPHSVGSEKELKNNKLKFSNSRFDVEFYPKPPEEKSEDAAGTSYNFTINEDGGIEFDLVLKEDPQENVFEFPVEENGLKFYYQSPLNPEHPTWEDEDGDGEADSFRPEMVIGSYAVYYEEQESTVKEALVGEKYKAGKAFHIYRPKVTDASGNEVWGELNWDEENKILRVSVDRVWLDNAAYPVRIDPNIGYETAGGTQHSVSSGYMRSTFPISAFSDGAVTKIYAYSTKRSSGGSAKCNIYNSSLAALDTTGTDEASFPSLAGWVAYNYSSGPTLSSSAGNYYITIWSGGSGYVYYDTATSTNIIYATATYGTWPSQETITASTYKFSVYAVYNAAGKPSAPGISIGGGGMMMF